MRGQTMDTRVDRPFKIHLVQMTTTYRGISSRGSNVLSFSMPNKHITYIIIGF